jgi:hypothetical protein
VNDFSLHKGRFEGYVLHYTIKEKTYIIHMFSILKKQQIPVKHIVKRKNKEKMIKGNNQKKQE